MVRYALLVALLLVPSVVQAQDIEERLAKLEADNKVIRDDLAAMKADIAAIKASLSTQVSIQDRQRPFSKEYLKAFNQALAENKPFVVFVNTPVRAIDGAITVGEPGSNMFGFEPSVILAVRDNQSATGLSWTHTLPPGATDNQIRDLLVSQRGGTSGPTRSAVPFWQSNAGTSVQQGFTSFQQQGFPIQQSFQGFQNAGRCRG
jgi:hypothetical protein